MGVKCSPSVGWKRMSGQRAFQKGVRLSRAESRVNVSLSEQWADLLMARESPP